MIEGIVSRIEKFYGKKFQVILTGGFAEPVMSGLKIKAVLDPLLTMKGIKYIYTNNMK
jgi:type III pantothenate kinase